MNPPASSASSRPSASPSGSFEPLFELPEGTNADRSGSSDRWLPVLGNTVLVSLEEGFGALTTVEANAVIDHVGDQTQKPILLGRSTVDGESTLWWTMQLPDDFDPQRAGDFMLGDLRKLMNKLDALTWNVAGRATQLVDWVRDNQHCGRCGGPMDRVTGERAMRCAADGFSAYPRLSPAVIVLIEHPDGRALLARNVGWPVPMYSTLAGFVEPGESLEDTIRREMHEEVGVEIGRIQYFGSQPWPFPNSLMLGFIAMWKSGDIVLAEDEIADAQWYTPDDLPMIPPPPSIARALIDDWIDRQS